MSARAPRLSKAEIRELLDAITSKSQAQPEASRRRDPRFTVPEGILFAAEISQPDGPSKRAIVTGRDIGRGGMGFLHTGPITRGTPVRLAIADQSRTPLCEVTGIVRRCEQVRGILHDIGVEFDAPINIGVLMRIVNKGDDPTATCKYPALLSLTQEVVELVRNGAELHIVLGMIEEVAGELREKLTSAGATLPEQAG